MAKLVRIFFRIFVIIFTSSVTLVFTDDIQVCPAKNLDIQCQPDEVIVTSLAKFGRMEFTRCTIVQDFIGCENDVLFLMDKWCSGRSRCHTIIPNDDLIASNKACLPYLRMYLQMQYSCLKVIQISHLDCQTPILLQNNEGVISSHMTRNSRCGSRSATLKISGISGQTIKLHITDFGSEAMKIDNTSKVMPLYGYIREDDQRTEIYGSIERQRLLYQSKSNRISVEIVLKDDDLGFLLHYQKIGCPDLTPPAHAWYKRDGDQAVIGCEWSQKTWHLSCDGRSWSGVVGNCSELVTQVPTGIDKKVASYSALWLVCVVSVSVVVMVIACVVGVVCIKKYRIKQDIQKSMTLQRLPCQGHYDLDPNIEMASMLYLPYKLSEEQQQGTLADPHRPTSYLIPQDQVVNELTPIRIWERPLPDLPDKPLACDTVGERSDVKQSRTPGDGDETVNSTRVQENDTIQSYQTDIGTISHTGQKTTALKSENAQINI